MAVGKARIFIDPDTDKFAQKHRWSDAEFIKAVKDLEQGLHDGAMGSGVFKRRIARKGSSRSAGYRLIVVLRVGDRAFVVEAFAKNVKEKHMQQEVLALRALADLLLGLSSEDLEQSLRDGDFREIKRTNEKDDDRRL